MDRTAAVGERSSTDSNARRLGRAVVAVLATSAAYATPALAHAGHQESDASHELAALLLVLGGGIVLAGLVLDRFGDLPRQYVQGLLLGGASLAFVFAPLFWFL